MNCSRGLDRTRGSSRCRSGPMIEDVVHSVSTAGRGPMKEESGFTLVELLAVITLMSILMAIGGLALRRYWFVQALSGAQQDIVSQLRVQQEESRTSAPKVFGARFTSGSSDWDLIQYDSGVCSRTETRTFDAGVEAEAVDFDTGLPTAELTACLDGATDLVLFYARGSATPGRVSVVHPTIDNRELEVCVTGLTGRVETC